jgi:hypothetical protein
VTLMGITEDVVRCWRERWAPGSVVGAEQGRGELFGGGQGYASELVAESCCQDSVSVKAPGNRLKGRRVHVRWVFMG